MKPVHQIQFRALPERTINQGRPLVWLRSVSGVGQGVGRSRGQWGQASCWQGCVLCVDVSLPAGLEQADKMLFFSQCGP